MARRSLESRLALGILALFIPPAAVAVAVVLLLHRRGSLGDPSVLAAVLVLGGLAIAAYVAAAAVSLTRALLGPLRALRRGTELMATVNPDHRLDARSGDDLDELARDVNQLADRLRDAERALAHESARAVRGVAGARDHLEAILAEIDEGVLVVTVEGAIALSNRAARALLGADAAVLGRSLLELVEPAPLLDSFARARAGHPVTARCALRTHHGASLHGRIVSLAGPNRAGGLLVVVRGSDVEAPAQRPRTAMGLVSGVAAGESSPERPLAYDFAYLERSSRLVDPIDGRHRLRDLSVVVLDAETTGLRASEGDRVVSLAAVVVRQGRICVDEAFDSLVNPQRPIPAASTQFHGITEAMVAGAPPIGAVLAALAPIVRNFPLAGHEIAFDLEFLDPAARQAGLAPLGASRPVLDTRLISYLVHGPGVAHSLEAVSERLGVTNRARHSALGDAIAAAEIFVKLVELLERRGVSTLGELLDALRRGPRS